MNSEKNLHERNKVYTANISRDGEVRHEYLNYYQKISDDDKSLEEISWSGKDQIESKTLYEYDSKGRLIKETNYYDDEEFSDGKELVYNDQDQLDMIRIKYADESETLQKYERQSNFSRISYYSEDNELEYTEERKMDENNKLLEFTKFGQDNKPEHIVKLSYDDYGRISETLDNNITEDFKSVTRMDYDDRNNLIKEVTYTEKGNIMNSRLSSYNEKDELIEEIVNDYTITYVLNDEGERVERKITNQSGQLEELTSYIYDEEGRIIEERFYKSSDLNIQDLFKTAYLRKRYVY